MNDKLGNVAPILCAVVPRTPLKGQNHFHFYTGTTPNRIPKKVKHAQYMVSCHFEV